jgi:hypothetical protein
VNVDQESTWRKQSAAACRGKALTLSIPVEKAQPVFLSEPFYTALVRAVALS